MSFTYCEIRTSTTSMARISQEKRQRALDLWKQGVTFRYISNTLSISKSSVGAIVQKYKSGFPTLDKAKSGRSKKLSNREVRRLVILSKKTPTATASELRQAAGIENKVSVDTVKRELRNQKLFGRIAIRKPLLTKKLIKKRFLWCQEKNDWSTLQWKRVIFTDEAKFQINARRRLYVRRNVSQQLVAKYLNLTVKHSPSITVWGAIRGDGSRTIVRADDIVDSNEYQRILSDALPNIYSSRFIFQHDGAPCHRSASTTAFLEAKAIRILQSWPPQSPDLSPIENVWEILKRSVAQQHPETKESLWQIVEKEFYDITNEKIINLYNSIPRRIRSVQQAKGGHTKY